MEIHRLGQKPLPGSTRSPSFSSSLLDSIDRSIDEDARTAAARRKPISDDLERLRKELITLRRSVAAPHGRRNGANRGCSSDSGTGGGVGPEAEANSRRRPKPIRTEKKKPKQQSEGRMIVAASPLGLGCYVPKPTGTKKGMEPRPEEQPPSREGRFWKTKSRALKMYGDMKRLNQPISPGARIATFLNSLFHTGGDSKKSPKASRSIDPAPKSFDSSSSSSSISTCSSSPSATADRRGLSQQAKAFPAAPASLSSMDPKSNASTITTSPSSSSSTTKSCLRSSPRPYKFGGDGAAKRCVRFSPVSVIIDGGGRKSRCESDSELTPTPIPRTRNHRGAQAEPVARGHGLRNHRQQKNREGQDRHGDKMDVDDGDDAVSYSSSSDLFDLDFLIDFDRYGEELPVYETTSLETNHAIANGLLR